MRVPTPLPHEWGHIYGRRRLIRRTRAQLDSRDIFNLPPHSHHAPHPTPTRYRQVTTTGATVDTLDMLIKPSEKADVFYVVMDASATAPTQANILAEATYAGDKTTWLAHGKETLPAGGALLGLSGLSAGRPKCYCATYAFQQEGNEKSCWKQSSEDKCYSATDSCATSDFCWDTARTLTMYYVLLGDQYKNEVFGNTGLSTSIIGPDCLAGSTFNAGTGKAPCAACATDDTCTNGVKTACTTTTDTVCNTAPVCPTEDTVGWADTSGYDCAEYATGNNAGGTTGAGSSWCLDSNYDITSGGSPGTGGAQANCVQVRKRKAERGLTPFVVVRGYTVMVCLVRFVSLNDF